MSIPISGGPGAPRRPGRPKRPEDAKLTAAIAAAREALGKRRPVGTRDVSAGDVEFAAMALIHAGAQPHPRLIGRITGGSLSTVSRLFQEWFAAFAQRSLDPSSPAMDLPTKVTLRLKLLVASLEAAVREQLLGVRRPEEVFQAAADLGERQALKAQIAALEAQRAQLTQCLESATYRVAQLEARVSAKAATATALEAAVQRLADTLASPGRTRSTSETTLKRVLAQVNALRETLHRPRPKGGPRRKRPVRPAAASVRRTTVRTSPSRRRQSARRRSRMR